MLMMLVAFVPALAAALAIYYVIRVQTLLPVAMTPAQLGGVFGIALLMSAISAFLSLSRLRRAQPAEIF
jgi:ABC-type antimicrobial peptide transport system permease subunit